MWSAWPEALHLYLGRTMAMGGVGADAGAPLVLHHAANTPVAQVLGELRAQIAARAMLQGPRRRSLHLTLSAGLCPALAFALPTGVTRWAERQAMAQAFAATALGIDADALACEMDAARPGLAAVLTKQLLQELKAWAAQQRWRIASIQPLWALASQCAAARSPKVQALLLHEPDGLTLLGQGAAGTGEAGELAALRMGAGQDMAVTPDLPAQTRRWLVGQGLALDQLLTLGFGAERGAPMADGPKLWASHWSIQGSSP